MSSKFSKLLLWLRRSRAEEGQAMVMVALSLVVILGFGAFAVDLGHVAVVKSDLQNAADAAALAGAADISKTTALQTAVDYAGLNGMKATENKVMKLGDTVTVTPSYKGDKTKIEVVCTRKVPYYFAGVLGFKETDVTARAVAQNNTWAGDALPFINMDGSAEDTPEGESLTAWNKVNPGTKERIHDDDLDVGKISPRSIAVKLNDPINDYIKGVYKPSIMFKKGLVMSNDVAKALEEILVDGKIVYLISIKSSELANYDASKLNNKDKIPVEHTVLLKCKISGTWKRNGSSPISLVFIDSYNWNSSEKTYLSNTGENPGTSPTLVE